MTDAVDLAGFMPADVTEYEVKQPGTGRPTGWTVTLAGPSHPKTVAWSNDAARKQLRRAQQIEAQQANGRKVKPEDKSVEEMKASNVAWVVSRIVDWTPVKIGGKEYPFSETNANELLAKPEMGWALGQLVDALADEATFTQPSASN